MLSGQGAFTRLLRILFLHQAGLAPRVGPRIPRATLRSGIYLRAAVMLCALWGLSAACLARETASPSALRLEAAPLLYDQGGVIADLDGDGRPDFAIVRAEGWDSKGLRYRIELQLSTGASPSSFSVSAEKGGLRLVPRDVDGDGDLDLVVMSAWGRAPVGVWINNGHGEFTRGEPTAYPRSIWAEGPEVVSSIPQEERKATVPQSYRSCIDFSDESYSRNNLVFERLSLFPGGAGPQEGAARWPQTRAPPCVLSQRPS